MLTRLELSDAMFVSYPFAVLPPLDDARMNRAAEKCAEEGCGLARKVGLDAAPIVAEASHGVAAAIIDVADQQDAMLIVMGMRGRADLRSLLLGSVAHDVAQHANRPLTIVPSTAVADARSKAGRGG